MNGASTGRNGTRRPAPALVRVLRRCWRALGRALGLRGPRVHRGTAPVLLYTAGKVGTNSLRAALRAAGVPVYKAHTLNAAVLRARMDRDRGGRGRPLHTDRATLRYVNDVLPGLAEVRTVTLVRETIGRNMSGFFETLWRRGIQPPYDGVDVDHLVELFFGEFNHARAESWFSDEFGPTVGVTPRGFGFDPERGYCEFASGRFRVLFMQLELGNEHVAQLLSAFTGRPVGVHTANVGTGKPYGGLYAEFKRRIVFPEEYLERQLGGPVMTAFYSAAQREHIRRYYRRQIPHLHPLPRSAAR